MFKYLFAWKHILTPLACEHYRTEEDKGFYVLRQTFRCWYVFGIRVFYYSTLKHE